MPLFHYRIGGLRVASELPLAGAIADPLPGPDPQVVVRRGGVPEALSGAAEAVGSWAFEGDRALVKIKEVVHFLITGGREIRVDVAPGVSEHDANIFLLGTAFGILQYQRGRMVLHASAVAVGDKAVLFCAPSGGGKSTLAAALSRRGYAGVSDDVCGIDFDGDAPTVLPDGRMLKLWADAVEHLELAGRKGPPIRATDDKYYVEPLSTAVDRDRELAAIYVLRKLAPGTAAGSGGIRPLGNADAALALRRNAYRPSLISRFGQEKDFFVRSSVLQRHAGVYALVRPFDLAAMDEVIARLEGHWRELGLLPGGGRRDAGRASANEPADDGWRAPPADLSDDVRIARADTWTCAAADDGFVMKREDAIDYVGLSETGGAIWNHLSTPLTLRELCGRLADDYATSPEVIREDVAGFVHALATRGVLLVS